MTTQLPPLLTLPCELRNAIYLYVFEPPETDLASLTSPPSPLEKQLRFPHRHSSTTCSSKPPPRTPSNLRALQTCRQIHREAHLLALSITPFHISGTCTSPDLFDLRSRALRPGKIAAIRHLTLSARISHLRALNEAWAGLPFGHPSLRLETLTIVPRRPDASHSAYAEVADLENSHTLAYIFGETLKGLKNVRAVTVVNHNCFSVVVWRLVYSRLVYRLWRWGGAHCGITFRYGEGEEEWFCAYTDGQEGVEVGEEVMRLIGKGGDDANLEAVG